MTQTDTPNGLEADYWTDAEIDGTPEWAKELLEIDNVDAVKKLAYGVVAVDTPMWFDDQDHGGPDPTVLENIQAAEGMSPNGWSVQKVTVKRNGNDYAMRLRLAASTPVCDAADCYYPADNVIHGTVLDGQEYKIHTCGRHR